MDRALRIYSHDDVVGVEVGGAVKNVIAIAAGICDGLGLGLNARAALITRGLAEITRLGVALGGRAETFMGLAGVGDLILTCTGDLSRNRRVGLRAGARRGAGGSRSEPRARRRGRVHRRAKCSAGAGARHRDADHRAVCRVLEQAGASPLLWSQELLGRDAKPEHAPDATAASLGQAPPRKPCCRHAS